MSEEKYVEAIIEFPRELVDEIDKAIEKMGCSFDEFVIKAVEYDMKSNIERRKNKCKRH